MAPMPETAPESTGFPASVTYKALNSKNDTYDGAYLRRLKAFYKGGKALLRNPQVMADVFPRYRDESDKVYEQRCARAFYLPYAGEILNFIVASIAAERLEVAQTSGEEGAEPPPLDEWWAEFFKDVSPPGGKVTPLHDYVKDAILDALQGKVSWHRADMPKPGEFASYADQERAGALDAYVVPLDSECVIDWEEDASGELTLVVTHSCESKRASLAEGREMVTDIWRVYTPTEWARYEFTHKKCEPITESQLIPLVGTAAHSFGRVPILRLDVGDGLWAMDNIEATVRTHFNVNSARIWAMLQALFPELYEFLGPEESAGAAVIGGNQKDESRAKRQRRGQGFVQERGKDDDARFIGPDSAPFAESRETCGDLRTEIHRVTHQMALAADNSAAALGRSADSKGHDKASAVVVFEALGRLARKFAQDICDMVARGRQNKDMVGKWQAKGMAKFDAISVDAEVERSVNLESVSIPSATFQRLRKLELAKAVLPEMTPEQIDAIEDELEEAITPESFMVGRTLDKVDVGKPKGGEEDDEEEDGKVEAAKSAEDE
jgi:hypothetical protein